MKIYRLAIGEQVIQQNPSAPANPQISLQNMQNAQSSLSQIDDIVEASNQVKTALDKLEEVLGAGDTGLKQDVSDKLNQMLLQNSAVKLLMQMNLLPSIASLFNSGDYDRIKVKINNDISKIQSESAQQNQPSQEVL
jgi:hypothetical protein